MKNFIMDEVCRLCLQPQSAMSPIFAEQNQALKLQSQIVDCCSIEVLENDNLPKLICNFCKTKLLSAYEFRRQCKESDLKLRNYYHVQPNKYLPDVDAIDKQDACVQTETIQLSVSIPKTKCTSINGEAGNDRLSPVEGLDFSAACIHYKKFDIDDEQPNTNDITDKEVVLIATVKEVSESENSQTGNSNNKVTRKETFSCNVCQKVYASKKTLTKHAKCHMNKDNHKRSSKRNVIPATTVTDNSNDLKCDVCNMPFTEQAKLNAHLRMHGIGFPVKTEIQYLCDICSKTFVSNSGLRFHLKSHNGSKPHLCKYCNKSFVIPSYKNRHERTHTGDKRFICHICSAAFASSNGLKYHLRTHTGESNYHCKTCGKSFKRYKYLKEHTFTHTGERPFACKICGLAYGNSGSLFVHEKKCKTRFARVTESLINAEQQAGDTDAVHEEVTS